MKVSLKAIITYLTGINGVGETTVAENPDNGEVTFAAADAVALENLAEKVTSLTEELTTANDATTTANNTIATLQTEIGSIRKLIATAVLDREEATMEEVTAEVANLRKAPGEPATPPAKTNDNPNEDPAAGAFAKMEADKRAMNESWKPKTK